VASAVTAPAIAPIAAGKRAADRAARQATNQRAGTAADQGAGQLTALPSRSTARERKRSRGKSNHHNLLIGVAKRHKGKGETSADHKIFRTAELRVRDAFVHVGWRFAARNAAKY
jgi:hypothetical protein